MKYIIPNFYDSMFYNSTLMTEFINTVDFDGIQGTFPFCCFNGWLNNIGSQKIALYKNIVESIHFYSKINEHILFDFGNLLLEETDYPNCMADVILKEYVDNKKAYFEIANLGLLDYLIQKYPTIQIVLHQNYTLFHTVEEINNLISKYPNNIQGVVVHSNFSIKDIKKISNNVKKFYFFSANMNCMKCKNLLKCIKVENQYVLDFSERSSFGNCQLYSVLKNKEIATQEIQNVSGVVDFVIFDTPYKTKIATRSFSSYNNDQAQKYADANEDIEINFYRLYEEMLGGGQQ